MATKTTARVLAALQYTGQTCLNQAWNRLDIDRAPFINAIQALRLAGVLDCSDPAIDDSSAPFAAICYTLTQPGE